MQDPANSETPDYYGILQVPRDASLAQITKAYKSLVWKWHPDKNPKNMVQCEAKIRAINEAYRAICMKKKEEDRDHGVISSDDPGMPDESLSSRQRNVDEGIFSRLTRNASRRCKTPTRLSFRRTLSRNMSHRSTTPTRQGFSGSPSRSTSNANATIPTTPLTPMTPTSPTLGLMSPTSPTAGLQSQAATLSKTMSRKIIFSQSAAAAKKKPPPVERKLECTLEELCRGGTKKIKVTRDVINEDGIIVKDEEILKIKIKPGWKKGTKITFEGKGDEKPGTLPADIVFVIDEKRHPMFRRVGDDLELGVEVPLIQALTGCSLDIPLLGGEKMTLSIDDIIYPGFEKTIPGQGMPNSKDKEKGWRGDLRLKFFVEFPSNLSEEQRSNIVRILNEEEEEEEDEDEEAS
ncbi:hypothetical protein NMG60_11032573 [Bertholletia excelsa]